MKRTKAKYTSVLSLLFFLGACAAGISQKSSSSKSGYQEDLSSFRPRYEKKDTVNRNPEIPEGAVAPPSNHITPSLNAKLDKISENNPKQAKGYRVRIYSGNNKDKALEAEKRAKEMTEQNVYVQWQAPNFRVKVGDEVDRLAVNILLDDLKTAFPDAIIVPDDVNVID